uniref:Uncharacterized protein n=1 Tax=Tanacetum cinerariifolium TaxID=118510 RepID=A0A6L2K725_TANCI|nr:hypothetical protein [Tanacetum cinerariifolium]
MMRETVGLQAMYVNESKIKILDYRHAEGTAKNSQDNKVLRLVKMEIILVTTSNSTAEEPRYVKKLSPFKMPSFGKLFELDFLKEKSVFTPATDSCANNPTPIDCIERVSCIKEKVLRNEEDKEVCEN